MLIFSRTLTIWNRGYSLPDSLYLPDNQQDICARIFCFCLPACLSFAAEQREHCFHDIKTDFTLMGLSYQLYIEGNTYQLDQHLLSQLLQPPTSCPLEICQHLLTSPLAILNPPWCSLLPIDILNGLKGNANWYWQATWERNGEIYLSWKHYFFLSLFILWFIGLSCNANNIHGISLYLK